MGLTAPGLVRAREPAGGEPRRAIAALTSGFRVGQIVGPLLAGVPSDVAGSFTIASLAEASALIAAAVLARI